MAEDDFAARLWQLKERSGLSYGVLGKELHLSGSTLHRYVIGDVVPTDYACVERFARLCKATPEELIELHRLWVCADVLRQRKERAAEPGPKPTPEPGTTREAEASAATGVAFGPSANAVPQQDAVPDSQAGLGVTGAKEEAEPRRGRRPHRRTVAIAGAVAAAAGSVAFVVLVPTSDTSPLEATGPTVATNPYKWNSTCSQHYLVSWQPAQVPPPPAEQNAPGWVRALDAVSGGDQLLALTVQNPGKVPVVLKALRVHIVRKGPPLTWNDYRMGVGCGGGVSTKSFAVNLDSGRPDASPQFGQRDFPFKVSESDPEVFYVHASAEAHDVSWYLELEWTGGKQYGTERIDDNGKPFRTSATPGRSSYIYPLGASDRWQKGP
ncbi:helix-turn-helix domain-containing protein [Streptomyces sp. NPDC019531]|uniref:helix-turn-helix domain-containing protein n=1 Tax=Streptomyces sp. NPDC019531 TaxID=3365062 RepID=UPI00385140FB